MANGIVKKTENIALGSFDGASSLHPTNLMKKSFNNAAILQPQPVASSAPPAASTPAPAQSVSSQKTSSNGKQS